MKNFSHRVLSAVIAVAILLFTGYFFKENGLYAITLLAVGLGARELTRLTLPKNEKFLFHQILFTVYAILVFLALTLPAFKNFTAAILILSLIAVCSVSILFNKVFADIQDLQSYVFKFLFGIVYISFLPATVAWIIWLPNGMIWFLYLLTLVFAGDIGAYLFGVTMGKTKLAPMLSPKKSLEGSVGGLLFSTVLGSAVFFSFLPASVLVLAATGFVGGLLGQTGDFFESLLKRVSGVKDSGRLMPGHGGILDRIDGVLFAAPWVYLIASIYNG